jgi:hypothetical protein
VKRTAYQGGEGVRSTLTGAQLQADSVQWITPLLDDVFISSVTAA